VGSVERLAMRSLVMCLVSGRGIFPQRSVVSLAKFQQSSRQNSISPHRRADWIFGPEIRTWRDFCVCNCQPFFVFSNRLILRPDFLF